MNKYEQHEQYEQYDSMNFRMSVLLFDYYLNIIYFNIMYRMLDFNYVSCLLLC